MRSRTGWRLAVHVILALAGLLMIVPLVWIVLTAFKERNEVSSQVPQWLPAHPTFANFLGVLDAMPFWTYYWNTMVVAFGLLGLQLVTVTLAAYAFARMEFWGRDVLFILLLVQLMIAPQSTVVQNYITVSVQDFAAGNTAMLIHSTGNLRFVRDSAKFEWGTAFLPKNKKQAVAIGGAGFYIFKKVPKEKQDAAWQFAKFATSPEMQARWNIGSGYIATRKSAFDLPIMKEYTAKLPQAVVARDQLPYALPEMSTHDNWKMRDVFVTTFQEILDEKYTPEAGMKKAQAEIEKILAPFQK